jgi:FkbM family methyltransferase
MNIVKDDLRVIKLQAVDAEIRQNENRRVYIWGCSVTSKMITGFCKQHAQFDIEAYVVDDVFYSTDSFEGKAVYKKSEWLDVVKKDDFVIYGFTNSKQAGALMKQLPEGVEGIYFHFPYSANAYHTYLTYHTYLDSRNRFEAVYDLLEDEKSKRVMEAFINACISGEIEELERLQTEGQYFNDLTKNCKAGCFVDLGAYVGDTIESAYKFYGEKLKSIVAFEPDRENMVELKKRLASCDFSNDKVTLVEKGVWSEKNTLFFSSSDSSSSIIEDGDITIEVDSVDHVLKNAEESVSYIKMDVEGSEREALLGATATIRKNHPIVATCVYHKPEDLYSLPEVLQSITGKVPYKFYLRYHGPDLRELVLYAIPDAQDI